MFDAFVATFLEGLEAFLVVAVALGFFRKGRRAVVAAAQLGLGVSAGVSVTAAWMLSNAENPNNALWWLAVGATAVVVLLAVDVWRVARGLVVEGDDKVTPPEPEANIGAWIAVFLGTVLLVSRSGMLSVLLFGSLLFQIGAVEVTAAAACGTTAAALLSWQWSRLARRLRPRTVVTATAVVVLIFLSHLVISDILGLWQNRLWPLL
jgi:high-affinity Fe2+/Pb2+ permease